MRRARVHFGLVLFLIYLALYLGFIYLNAFSAETMEKTPLYGINVAVLYGFGLILVAFVLAALYGVLSGPADKGHDDQEGQP